MEPEGAKNNLGEIYQEKHLYGDGESKSFFGSKRDI